MKNQNKGFIVPVLIGIIALLIIGGGVYVYENKKVETPISTDVQGQQSNQNQQPTGQNTVVTPVTQNKPPQISTSNWKTYTDSTSGFSLKYPTGWQVLPSVGTLTRIAFGQAKNIGTAGYDGEWFIFVYSDSETNINNMRKSLGEETESISINGVSALRLVKVNYESILIKKNGKNYWINNGNIKNDQFSSFYNSLKFTPTVTTPTAGLLPNVIKI